MKPKKIPPLIPAFIILCAENAKTTFAKKGKVKR